MAVISNGMATQRDIVGHAENAGAEAAEAGAQHIPPVPDQVDRAGLGQGLQQEISAMAFVRGFDDGMLVEQQPPFLNHLLQHHIPQPADEIAAKRRVKKPGRAADMGVGPLERRQAIFRQVDFPLTGFVLESSRQIIVDPGNIVATLGLPLHRRGDQPHPRFIDRAVATAPAQHICCKPSGAGAGRAEHENQPRRQIIQHKPPIEQEHRQREAQPVERDLVYRVRINGDGDLPAAIGTQRLGWHQDTMVAPVHLIVSALRIMVRRGDVEPEMPVRVMRQHWAFDVDHHGVIAAHVIVRRQGGDIDLHQRVTGNGQMVAIQSSDRADAGDLDGCNIVPKDANIVQLLHRDGARLHREVNMFLAIHGSCSAAPFVEFCQYAVLRQVAGQKLLPIVTYRFWSVQRIPELRRLRPGPLSD